MSRGLSRPIFWLAVSTASAVFLFFLPVLSCGFVDWDDPVNIILNPHFRGLSPSHIRWMFTNFTDGHYLPVTWLSLGLDFTLWGMDPFGYHLTNLLVHCANAVLFLLLSRRLLSLSFPGADDQAPALLVSSAFCALVFALHPLRVEPVAWVTERREVLSAGFYLASVLLWLRGTEGRASLWNTAGFGASVLALLAKSMAVTLPLTLLVLEVHPLGRLPADPRKWVEPGKRRWVWEKAPFLAASAVLGAATYIQATWVLCVRPLAGLSLVQRAAFVSHGLVFYLRKTLWPMPLLPIYEVPYPFDPCQPVFLASGLAVLAAFAGVWRWRRRFPGVSAAAVFYVLALLPVIGIAPIGGHLVADRYSYVPCMAWALLAGAGLFLLLSRSGIRGRTLAAGGAVAVVAGLGALSWRQTSIWKDSRTLWTSVLSTAPDTPTAHNNLAAVLGREGGWPEAVGHLREALRLRPLNRDYRRRLAGMLYNQGSVLSEAGRRKEAIQAYEEAAGLGPGSADLYVNYGLALAGEGRLGEACRQYARALSHDRGSVLARYNWGNALSELGRLAEARQRYEAALALDPGMHAARFNLGNVLAREGDYKGAMRHYRILALAQPDYPGLRRNMEAALAGTRSRLETQE